MVEKPVLWNPVKLSVLSYIMRAMRKREATTHHYLIPGLNNHILGFLLDYSRNWILVPFIHALHILN
jgi:hypothetical protein